MSESSRLLTIVCRNADDYLVVEEWDVDSKTIARCSSREYAERIIAALSAAAASPTTADRRSEVESSSRLTPPWRERGKVQVRLTNRGRLPFHGPDDPDPEQTVTADAGAMRDEIQEALARADTRGDRLRAMYEDVVVQLQVAEQQVTDLVDLIHEHGSLELIAMADALLDVPNSAENAHSNI